MEFSRTGMKSNMKIILSKYMTMSHCKSLHPTLVKDESFKQKWNIVQKSPEGFWEFIEIGQS